MLFSACFEIVFQSKICNAYLNWNKNFLVSQYTCQYLSFQEIVPTQYQLKNCSLDNPISKMLVIMTSHFIKTPSEEIFSKMQSFLCKYILKSLLFNQPPKMPCLSSRNLNSMFKPYLFLVLTKYENTPPSICSSTD